MNSPFNPEAGGKHYGKTDPFVLTRAMETSGNAHVDGCRTQVIKYGFRMKGKGDARLPKLIDDLRKAAHYATEAADTLERQLALAHQPELPFAEAAVGEADLERVLPHCPQCRLSAAACPCDPSPFDPA